MGRKTSWLSVGILICLLVATVVSEGADGIPVLIYHQILPGDEEPGETRISLVKFKEQMKYLYEKGYTTISIDELIRFMKTGLASAKPIVITFDDGWKSVMEAIPVLKQYHFKATFFIFPGTGIGYPHMNWSDITALAEDPYFQIESHSLTHPWDEGSNLVTWREGKPIGKDATDAKLELRGSKEILEKALHKEVRYFAWPMGWYDETLIEMARDAGYEALLTVEEGDNKPGGDIFRINRILVDGACDMTIFRQMLLDHKHHVCQTKDHPTLGHLPY